MFRPRTVEPGYFINHMRDVRREYPTVPHGLLQLIHLGGNTKRFAQWWASQKDAVPRGLGRFIGTCRLWHPDYCGLIAAVLISLPNRSVSFRTWSVNSSGVPPTAVAPRKAIAFDIVGEASALLISEFNR